MFFSNWVLGIFLIYNYSIWQNLSGNKNIRSPRAYYISPFGNDRNAGSRGSAFQSIQRLNLLQLRPGDSILFEGGNIFKGSLQLGKMSSGVAEYPIYISSFGGGRATILAGNETAIRIENAAWIQVKNLKLTGSGRKKGNIRDGISITNCHQVLADSLDISGFQKSGIRIDSSSDISLLHIYSHENGYAGISVGGRSVMKNLNRHIYIGHCKAENNPGDPSNLDNHSGNGIVVSGCTDVMIEYCTATNNGWDMPRKGNGPVGIWAFEAERVTIQHCIAYRNKTSAGAADGGGFDFDGGVTHSVIQYCLSYENQGAGYCIFQYLYASPWHDNVIRFNISENDGKVSDAHAGIYVWNSSRDSNQFYNSYVYNNTIYNTRVAAISYSELSERKGFAFYNNIFIAGDSLIHGNKGRDIFLGNSWGSFNTNLHQDPVFKKDISTTLTSVSRLKDFNSYRISPRSLLRNGGIDLFAVYGMNTGGLDFNGGKPPASGIGASF